MHKIDIQTKVQLIKQDGQRHTYAYTVTIANNSEIGAILLNRYWHIEDAQGKVQEVRGKGVIGKQPYLEPGEQFTYSSGATIETSIATMHGHFEMQNDEGNEFIAEVPMFLLADKSKLH